MERPKYIVRQMREEDFEEVIGIFTEAGFTIAKHGLNIAYNLDAKGLFVAQDLDSSEILGSCTGIKLSESFAFISTYAVKYKYQNKGIGSAICKQVIEHIGQESNISFTSVGDMITKYCKNFGPVVVEDKILVKYVGEHSFLNFDSLVDRIENVSIIHINDENLKSVAEYDMKICGFNRESLLNEALKQSETVLIAAIQDNDKKIVGYCKLSLSNINYVLVQPLYANNTVIAELLLSKGWQEMSKFKSEGLVIFSWDSNDRMKAICDKIGLTFIKRRTKNIYTKIAINCDFNKIYARSSLYIYPY